MLGDALKIFELLASYVGKRRRLRLAVHRAAFAGSGRECFFINATNLSEREIEITHVWVDCGGSHVPALQPQRLLPKRLKPDEAWETWVEVSDIPVRYQQAAFTLARARLSTGYVVKSKREDHVPQQGTVPGGPI